MDALKGLAGKLGNNNESSQQQGSNDKGDYLDQAVGAVGSQFGQNFSRDQEEKYSDYVREGYTKATGKDIPIADKDVATSQGQTDQQN